MPENEESEKTDLEKVIELAANGGQVAVKSYQRVSTGGKEYSVSPATRGAPGPKYGVTNPGGTIRSGLSTGRQANEANAEVGSAMGSKDSVTVGSSGIGRTPYAPYGAAPKTAPGASSGSVAAEAKAAQAGATVEAQAVAAQKAQAATRASVAAAQAAAKTAAATAASASPSTSTSTTNNTYNSTSNSSYTPSSSTGNTSSSTSSTGTSGTSSSTSSTGTSGTSSSGSTTPFTTYPKSASSSSSGSSGSSGSSSSSGGSSKARDVLRTAEIARLVRPRGGMLGGGRGIPGKNAASNVLSKLGSSNSKSASKDASSAEEHAATLDRAAHSAKAIPNSGSREVQEHQAVVDAARLRHEHLTGEHHLPGDFHNMLTSDAGLKKLKSAGEDTEHASEDLEKLTMAEIVDLQLTLKAKGYPVKIDGKLSYELVTLSRAYLEAAK